MITNTIPVNPPVEGGESLLTYLYKLKHFRIKKMLLVTSLFVVGLIESQSNNTSNSISARDARNINRGLLDIEREFKWMKEHRNDPTGARENVYQMQFPRPEEILAMPNIKLQSVAEEAQNFFNVCIGKQDVNHGIWIGADSEEDIDLAFNTLKQIVTALVGTGEKDANGVFDVGAKMANYDFVGSVNPPLVAPHVRIQEAGAGPGSTPVDDAPDGASFTTRLSGVGNTTNTSAAPAPSGGASA